MFLLEWKSPISTPEKKRRRTALPFRIRPDVLLEVWWRFCSVRVYCRIAFINMFSLGKCYEAYVLFIEWYECQKVFWHSFDTRIATQLRCSRNPPNIRNPLIYCVNRYFLIFGVSQVQKPYRASTNSFLTFWHWYHNKIHYNKKKPIYNSPW